MTVFEIECSVLVEDLRVLLSKLRIIYTNVAFVGAPYFDLILFLQRNFVIGQILRLLYLCLYHSLVLILHYYKFTFSMIRNRISTSVEN